ncbi:hypothetical protein LA080_000492 [Diaporthe eres]|uniref:Uncharacterized protein n=1 Tax=Diaporthe vaccinii TaxID=105482 RepID=A0ABR4DPD6_9PEZI|nr:hypothetical protein LA080_000492 [Diaporthe eres]
MLSQKRPRGIVRTHVIPFEDHAGQPALTVLKSSSPLPFLYSFSFYFTHPDASRDTSHAAGLYETLTRGSIYDSNDVEFRLDLYFLPNASQDDCIAHYRAEKDARGTYQAQVDAVASGDAQPPSAGDDGGSRLPGLVASYAYDKSRFPYHGLLLILDAADWREGDELLTHVEFDPLSREDYERYCKDPGDPREPDVLPETQVHPEALTEDSPGHGRELPRPHFGVRALEKTLWERVPMQEAWQEARHRGWTTW